MSIQAEGFKFDVESLFIVVPAVIALAGIVVSWWREQLGGSLLILVSIAFGVLPSMGAGWSILRALQGWLMLGLPFLVAGVLFLISWWLSRRTGSIV
jgi:lipoprotein signal peptidase